MFTQLALSHVNIDGEWHVLEAGTGSCAGKLEYVTWGGWDGVAGPYSRAWQDRGVGRSAGRKSRYWGDTGSSRYWSGV